MVRIGDYVVDNEEIMLLIREWGGADTDMETKTNIGTLVPTIFNIRIGQYDAALTERLKLLSGGKRGSVDPVIKLLVKHFVGINSPHSFQLAIELSIALIPMEGAISTIVGDCIRA